MGFYVCPFSRFLPVLVQGKESFFSGTLLVIMPRVQGIISAANSVLLFSLSPFINSNVEQRCYHILPWGFLLDFLLNGSTRNR